MIAMLVFCSTVTGQIHEEQIPKTSRLLFILCRASVSCFGRKRSSMPSSISA